ncbi:LCP family protein [Clostridium thermarum]|uniref:LCP family protein n=1 Tax=Clostridium thermarum TaxID=1716543 RepID=UPI00111E41E8|nr:LCP family protein [Clostridium thermarum]
MKARTVRKSLSILIILSFIVIAFLLYIYNGLQKIRRVEIPQNYEELGIKPQAQAHATTGIRNIALFGIDIGRHPNDPPHSDSIIIVTIDSDRNKLKFTSILRDSYVEVEGHKKTKITEAYAYGGPALAIKTLNQNFNLDIKDYITVDFLGLAKIIDTLGGINIDVKEKEIKEINKWSKELYELKKLNPVYIKDSGLQKLNGIQAVAYCRIRKIGAGEFDRTRRQRQVLNALISNINEKGLTRLPSLIWEITPYVETNITTRDMLTTGTSILISSMDNIEQMRFPLDGYCKGEFITGVWYLTLQPDIETTALQLYDYIYKDIKPESREPLF